METVKNFIVKNYKSILAGLVGLFLLYWFIFILTPKNTMLKEDRKQIEALNDKIEEKQDIINKTNAYWKKKLYHQNKKAKES